MNRMEKNYIKLELGVATWEVDINNDAMNDILDMGVECYPEEVYEIAYEEGYEISEDKLKMMFEELMGTIIILLIVFSLMWKIIKKFMLNLIDRENERYEKEKENDWNKS